MDPLTLIYCFLITSTILALIRHFTRRNNIFYHLSLKGPEPDPFIGNVPTSLKLNDLQFTWGKWGSQFGSTFGYMEGGTPVIVTTDMDVVEEVFDEESKHYQGRKDNSSLTSSDRSLFYASNDEHKRQWRSVSNAMKKVDNKTVNETFMNVNVLKDLIEEAISDYTGEVLATEMFEKASCAAVASSISTVDLSNKLKLFQNVLHSSDTNNLTLKRAYVYFPEFSYLWKLIARLTNKDDSLGTLNATLTNRRQGDGGLLDVLHEALKREEYIDNATHILTHGSSCVSKTLSFTFLLLAMNPAVQQQIYDEITTQKKTDSANSIIRSVLLESLRLFPHTAFLVNRRCTQGLSLPTTEVNVSTGCVVQADVWTIHRQGEDGGKFDPTRWINEKGSAAFLAFGAGKRECLGKKLAMRQMKNVVEEICGKYTVHLTTKTSIPIKLGGPSSTTPLNSYVQFRRR